MKRAAAIVLSLIFVWLQEMSAARSLAAPIAKACACCDCKKTECCVSEATPDAQPPVALPATGAPTADFSVFIPALVTWTLPGSATARFSPSDSAPFAAPAVPLFTRHCALLI